MHPQVRSQQADAIYPYPGQVYEHIKKHQPEKLAQELLPMFDPINLITYQLDCGINDLEKFDGDPADICDYPLTLKFKLGTLEIVCIEFEMEDVHKGFIAQKLYYLCEEHQTLECLCQLKGVTTFRICQYIKSGPELLVLDRDNITSYMKNITKTNNAGIWGELDTDGLYRHILVQFRPEVYDAILRDLFNISVQYGKFLAKQ